MNETLSRPILTLKNINKSYIQGDGKSHQILKNINLSLNKGQVISIVGPSGSGKSTLLHTAALLDKCDSGEIIINDKNCSTLSEVEQTKLRLNYMGFVYQFHHLMPEFSVLENLLIPQILAQQNENVAINTAKSLLIKLGLESKENQRTNLLSGGEQQRVAIARAFVNQPKILFADEPTGNLDEENASIVMNEFIKTAKEKNMGVIFVTHNKEFAAMADLRMNIHNGILYNEL